MNNKYFVALHTHVAQAISADMFKDCVEKHGAHSPQHDQLLREYENICKVADVLDGEDTTRCAFNKERVLLCNPIDGTVFTAYFECLARFKDEHGDLLPPADIFPALDKHGLSDFVDAKILKILAHEAGKRAENEPPLAINMMPNSLNQLSFREYARDVLQESNAGKKLMIEVVEEGHLSIPAKAWLLSIREEFGTPIVLDDFGRDKNSHTIQDIYDLKPSMIKLDGRHIVRPCFDLESPIERDIHIKNVRELVTLIRCVNEEVKIVAEWTETPEEYRFAMQQFGIDGAQSFKLERSMEHMLTLTSSELERRNAAHDADRELAAYKSQRDAIDSGYHVIAALEVKNNL